MGMMAFRERVHVEDPLRPGPLGACCPHEVLGHGLHHGGPHVAAERRDGDGGQGQDGQHERAWVGEDPERGRALGRLGRK